MTIDNKMKILKYTLTNSISYLAIPLILLMVYSLIFINMPISEDTGYYGFIAKSINSGSILHVDIPISTNGIFIYELALIFKIFGNSLTGLRLLFLIHLFIITLFLFKIIYINFKKYMLQLSPQFFYCFFASLVLCWILEEVPM